MRHVNHDPLVNAPWSASLLAALALGSSGSYSGTLIIYIRQQREQEILKILKC